MEYYTVLGRNNTMDKNLEVTKPEPATTRNESRETEVGSVFVSNYPPYSFWSEENLPTVENVLKSPPNIDTDLGLYLHIPFCRKRCKFCYFRVYVDKNSSEIETYLDLLVKEVELYSQVEAVKRRPLKFVYFGGGTPSYMSSKHLEQLVARLKSVMSWESAQEVAFECEPGTLTQSKLQTIREIGVTRLSLGVENLNDTVLVENGRAHSTKEIYRVIPWIHDLEFDQLNIDLIAGMVGETWESWKDTVKRTIDLDPDSITVYQMELPFNTVYSKEILGNDNSGMQVANWKTKREWHNFAFEQFESADYRISSAYTMVKKTKPSHFVYRDAVWHSSDLLGTGVASFSHVNGVHFQNLTDWKSYIDSLDTNRLPLGRALATSKSEKLVREMILQLKLGRIKTTYFLEKFGVNILEEFASGYNRLRDEGMLTLSEDQVILTRKGLLQVDQLLPEFYDMKYRNSRYT